jgi:hypothetical protein
MVISVIIIKANRFTIFEGNDIWRMDILSGDMFEGEAFAVACNNKKK